MKKLILLSLVLGFLVSCRTSISYNPTAGEVAAGVSVGSGNFAAELQAAYNVLSGEPGNITLTLIFKKDPPKNVVALLEQSKAIKVRGNVWVLALPSYSRHDAPAFRALQESLRVGANVL